MNNKNIKTKRVRITDMNNLGNGVARNGGKVVFVKHGVDGDECDIEIIKSCRDYDVARIEALISPSSYRTESPCAASLQCGGCVYTGITGEHELELKLRTVADALRKAGLPDIPVGEVRRGSGRLAYRNKLQLPVGKGSDGRTVLGYYAEHSHRIVPCESCLLERPELDGISGFVREFADSSGWNCLRHLYLRCGTKGGEAQVMVCLVVTERPEGAEVFAASLTERFPEVRSVMLCYNNRDTNVILGDSFEKLCGDEYITDTLCGLEFRMSPGSFYQVNRDSAELAYRIIGQKLALKPGERLLDLYCGIGTIGLCVAAEAGGISLTGIEIVPSAVENARYNARVNGFRICPSDVEVIDSDGSMTASFICGDAEDVKEGVYDAIVIDPPRSGCSEKLIGKLASLMRSGTKRLVYMSCSPATFARDAARLASLGVHIIGEVTPVDMFPCTGHIETIALMSIIKPN